MIYLLTETETETESVECFNLTKNKVQKNKYLTKHFFLCVSVFVVLTIREKPQFKSSQNIFLCVGVLVC